MAHKTVIRKPDSPVVMKPKRISRRNRRKVYVHTLASVFKSYDEALAQADLLFEVFSPERLQAQRVALDRLKERLSNLGIDNIDWDGAYSNVVQYARIVEKPAK